MLLEEKENPEYEKIIIKPTNVKPDSWYQEICSIDNRNNVLDADELEELKEYDEKIDLYYFMQEAWREKDQLEYGRKYYLIYNKEIGEYEKIYLKTGEHLPEPYLTTYNEMEYQGKELPSKFYKAWNDLHYYEDREFFDQHNNPQDNRKYLNRSKKIITLLKKNSLKDEKYLNFKLKQVEAYYRALKEGYLITSDLCILIETIEEDIYNLIGHIDSDCSLINKPFNFDKLKNLLLNKDPGLIKFDGFQINNEELYDLLRKNERWYDCARDISIYLERSKGKYLQELADQFHMKRTAVSMVIKKVQGAVNYWRGKLFENFIEERLKSSRLFDKVVKDAGSGESDIKAYTKDNELFIYSLKNLKIDRSPHWLITKEELLPELKDALLSKLDYETQLILLIYDNFHKEVKRIVIDYNNPKNIDISK